MEPIRNEFKEFLESLNSEKVEYLVIGAHALALHGTPRFTGDMDIFIRISPTNALGVERAIADFGLGGLGHLAADFMQSDIYVQLGVAPVRIDITTGISGVTFEEAWPNRVAGELGGVPVFFIGKEDYIKNKRASGRAKDMWDLNALRK